MYRKFFAWSFDDGLEQDKKIVATLKEYGMGATFHLNSGLYGRKYYVGRIGNIGVTDTPVDSFRANKKHLLSYVPHFRIPEDEVVQVYDGFEIAAHGLTHQNLEKCGKVVRDKEIREDIITLSEQFGHRIDGFAYPYGVGVKQSRETLVSAGIQYARTVRTTSDFRFPADPFNIPITCHHISAKTFSVLERFIQMEPKQDDLLFLMFAHGYEFDFETKESNWGKFRRICETVCRQDDIVCCSVKEALHLHGETVGRKDI